MEELLKQGNRPPVLAVDLDGTIINPHTEELIPGARESLIRLKKDGWKIVIWTARDDAHEYVPEILQRLGVPFDAVNDNVGEVASKSRKIFFDAIVDDKNVSFDNGWDGVVRDLEDRRKDWQHAGITKEGMKVRILRMDPMTGDVREERVYGLDKSGKAILLEGVENPDSVEKELVAGGATNKGAEFLQTLLDSVNTSFVWAEEG